MEKERKGGEGGRHRLVSSPLQSLIPERNLSDVASQKPCDGDRQSHATPLWLEGLVSSERLFEMQILVYLELKSTLSPGARVIPIHIKD